ncbi:MAG: hypothetical protein GY765_42350, partial [bacterium]|nr:hypothetical protein [bacterium]
MKLQHRLFKDRAEGSRVARLFCSGQILFRWLWPPKLQLILTLLTMAIGSLTLAATFFIGDGALNSLWKDLDRLMGNRIDVYADVGPNDIMLKKRPSADLSNEDLEFIKAHIPWSKYVVPMFFDRAEVKSSTGGMIMQLEGIVDQLMQDELYRPLKGGTFSLAGRRGAVAECLITEAGANRVLTMDLHAQQ